MMAFDGKLLPVALGTEIYAMYLFCVGKKD